jgi:hypothetical protein
MLEPNSVADIVVKKLSVHLGPHVAKVAIRTFAQQAVALNPEQLTMADVPKLIEAMKPMLSVMIGRAPSGAVLEEIARACTSGAVH